MIPESMMPVMDILPPDKKIAARQQPPPLLLAIDFMKCVCHHSIQRPARRLCLYLDRWPHCVYNDYRICGAARRSAWLIGSLGSVARL